MWNERFSAPGYFFGLEAAMFLRDNAHLLSKGARTLAVADGEGRNSVFMAGRGLDVTAMDNSPVGVEKARALAADHGVSVDFRVADIYGWQWPPNTYDIVAAIFIQFAPPTERAEIFNGIRTTLKPGGLLLLHGYTPKQIEYGTGGPPYVENMYTVPMLRQAFDGFDILRLEEYDREIHEGTGHSGNSALIDLVARKPEN